MIRLALTFLTTFLLLSLCIDGKTKTNDESFSFIETSSDSSSLRYVRTFKCISKKGDDLESLYRAIKLQAIGIGANCFRYNNFMRDSMGTMALTLDTYYGDDTFTNINLNNHERNTVYIISDGNFNSRTYTFKTDKEKRIIKSGTYYKHTINKGEKVKIKKGGFFGASATISWDENNTCEFFSLSGFGLADMPLLVNPMPRVGVSFTTGRLKPVERSFGLLLTMILKQS